VLVGFAKKALCADYLAGYVDLVFGAPRAYGGFEIVLAVYAYSAQIYLDFSGYTDIALGFARILGIALPENFDAPYRATSITDFWRRWHMSLSRWLRDYLYIPLGGNRRGPVRRVVNLMITMLLGGLWHGAAWTFVLWGGVHGVALALDRWARGPLARLPARLRQPLGWLLTFHLVAGLWLLFRAPSFEAALELGAGVGRGWELGRTATVLQVRHAEVAAVALGLGVSLAPTTWWRSLAMRFARIPWPAQALLFAGLLLAADLIPKNGIVPFVYFQF
jgi:D-alanyl-lipoteichoic acid acyltransferase DltB (MBOAT superfamily)